MSFRIENGILKEYLPDKTKNSDVPKDVVLREDIIIPEGVTHIGDFAFSNCLDLHSVQIPEGCTEIGKCAFENCWLLDSAEIPDSVTRIEEEAFFNCYQLRKCSIPRNLSFVGKDAFCFCEKLRRRPVAVVDGKLLYEPLLGGYVQFSDMQRIFIDHDYSSNVPIEIKYSLMTQMYLLDIDKENTGAYLKKNFLKVFRSLLHSGEIEQLEQFALSGKFLTKRNIDKLIEATIQAEQTNLQLLLMEYKNQKLGYTDTAKKFRL